MRIPKVLIIIPVIILVLTAFFHFIFTSYKIHRGGRKSSFLEKESDYYIADELGGHVHKPYAKRNYTFDEHEKNRIVLSVNNLGFRKDTDTRIVKPMNAIRVLVTGDSHIDGVIYNYESFPERLENLFNAKGEKNNKFEFLNGGTGYYGPQNYLGFLKKYIYLKPDVFIVVVYTGNDFLETIKFAEANGNLTKLLKNNEYFTRLKDAYKILPPAVAQALNQVYYFKNFPQRKSVAVNITTKQLAHIHKLCFKKNIKFLVLLLPTKLDIDNKFNLKRFNKLISVLELSNEEINVNRNLTIELIHQLKKKNINYFDLFELMRNKDYELFWKVDYHLNNKGHALIADFLYNSWQSFFY